MTPSTSRWHDGLVLALCLAIAFLALCYLRILGDSQTMAFSDHVLNALYAGSIWGTTLSYNLIKFALGVLFLHLVFGVACWLMGQVSERAWPSSKTSRRQHVLIWFILLVAGLLANNAATFTTSSLGQPYAELMTRTFGGITLGRLILYSVLLAAAVTAIVATVRWWRAGGRLSHKGYAGLAALGVIIFASSGLTPRLDATSPTAKQPNVILIGLDSMREDILDERLSPNVTPHLAAFMKQGTQFTNAITPLARTFPSMCSMLTGRNPHTSGAVMNLLPRNLIDDSESMPRLLQRAGYTTVYATDETRFANIDSSYGFAQTITPPLGASEFLIEKIADAPLFNVLVNARLVGWMFPHVYGNRGASRTYDPDVFVRRIDDNLRPESPLFLVAHLTLSHWPYIWAGAPIKRDDKEARWPPYYLEAARRVDQQFADIMRMLERKGLLENAVVVVYSDHGESFGGHESLVPEKDPLLEALEAAPGWGHGSSVFTDHQFRIILGMRRFGGPWTGQPRIDAPVSFEDIAPTVMDLVGIPTTTVFDGKSLVGLIDGHEASRQALAGRIRFTETEYKIPADMATPDGAVSTSKVEEALRVYHIDRVTDRITVKQNHLPQLLLHRHYAAVGEKYLLAAIPAKGSASHSFIAVELRGGTPRQIPSMPDASEPELLALWSALHQRHEVLRAAPPPVAVSAVADSGRTVPPSVTK